MEILQCGRKDNNLFFIHKLFTLFFLIFREIAKSQQHSKAVMAICRQSREIIITTPYIRKKPRLRYNLGHSYKYPSYNLSISAQRRSKISSIEPTPFTSTYLP